MHNLIFVKQPNNDLIVEMTPLITDYGLRYPKSTEDMNRIMAQMEKD